MAEIEVKHRELMNVVAGVLQEVFDGYGFCLLVFDQGTTEGRMNYISNSNGEDMVTALKEFIANHEGRMMEGPDTPQ